MRPARLFTLLTLLFLGLQLVSVSSIADAKPKKKGKKAAAKVLKKDKASKPAVKKVSKKDKKAAAKLAKKGKKALKKKKWDLAISAYTEAFDKAPNAKHLGQLGRAYEGKGDLLAGVLALEKAVAGIGNEKLKKKADKALAGLVAKLEKTHGRLRLKSKPKGAKYKLKKGKLSLEGETPAMIWLEAGKWKVRLTMEGRKKRKKKVTIKAGELLKKKYKLKKKKKKKKKEEAPPPVAKVEPPPPPPPPAKPSIASLAAMGGGVAALGAGAFFGYLSQSKQDERNQLGKDGAFLDAIKAADEDAKSHAMMANVLMGVGGLGIAAGAVLFVLGSGGSPEVAPEAAPEEKAPEKPAASLMLVPMPGGIAFTIGGEL